tara:strand:- start:256 stop:444 length:189 start_codon:yes stop_codon:yes gene_type:complete
MSNNYDQKLIEKLLAREEKRKMSVKKYQQSEKGKLAQKKANAKRYKPTGRPRGRPKKTKNPE